MNLPPLGKITLLFGRICSGKGHLCDMIKEYQNGTIIHTSSAVKSLCMATDRESLQSTANLDAAISKLLLDRISLLYNEVGQIVVEGIRQKSIVEAIMAVYNVDLVWIECSKPTRMKRFHSRKDPKDAGANFDYVDGLDDLLGLEELEMYLKSLPQTTILINE